MGRRPFKSLQDIPLHCLPANLSHAQELSQPKRSKYRNKRTFAHGAWFDSKHEAYVYGELLLLKAAGQIRAVIRQVSLPLLSGKTRMRIDFLVIDNDERARWIDAKGYVTAEWKIKRTEVESAYGLKIELA